MGNNIFDYIRDDFFSIFNTIYKRINYDILQFLYNNIDLSVQTYSKNELVDIIYDFLSDYEINLDKPLKEFCYDRINSLIDYGWLLEDNDGFRKSYELDENGIKLLQVMDEISKNETKQYEFTGYVYNIYSSLTSAYKSDKIIGIIEQAYLTSVELRNNLKGLNTNIRKYLTNLLRNNKAKPNEILNIVLTEYQDKVVLRAFKNLREKDNPHLYKNEILNKIDEFKENRMDSLINKYIDIKCNGIDNETNRNDAYNVLNNQLDFIYDLFYNIEDMIEQLESKNTKYLSSAKARVKFLLNENSDFEGNVISLLKELKDVDEEFYDQELFNIYESYNVNNNSLYTQGIKKDKPLSEIENVVDLDYDIDTESLRNKILKENEFNVLKINEFIMLKLKNKNSINLCDIEVLTLEDVIKLFLVLVFSNNSKVTYKITKFNGTFEVLGWTLENYVIEKKVK